jgi:hypothetical protein
LRALNTARSKFLAWEPPNDFARETVALAGPATPRREPRDWSRDFPNFAVIGLLTFFLGSAFWYGHEAASSWSRVQAGTAVQVLAMRDGRETQLRDGDALGAGEKLELEYSLTRARYLLLLGVDETGRIHRYFPGADASAQDALLVPTSRARLPPIDVGAHGGDQRIYALFADVPIMEAVARQAISQAAGAAWAAGNRIAHMPALDLPVQSFSIWFRRDI